MVQVPKVEIEPSAVNVAFPDVESTLQATASFFSGPNAPGLAADRLNMQPWADTNEGFLKVWDQANGVWIRLLRLTELGGFADTGDIKMTMRDTASEGWVLCNGAHYPNNTAEFAPLFAVIGNRFTINRPDILNAGRFQVPDFRNRFPVGASPIPVGTEPARSLMTYGGVNSVALNVNQIPAHNHGVVSGPHSHSHNNPQHSHNATIPAHGHNLWISGEESDRTNPLIYASTGVAGDVAQPSALYYRGNTGSGTPIISNAPAVGVNTNPSGTGLAITANTQGISIQNRGGNQIHTNVPAYISINYVIKL